MLVHIKCHGIPSTLSLIFHFLINSFGTKNTHSYICLYTHTPYTYIFFYTSHWNQYQSFFPHMIIYILPTMGTWWYTYMTCHSIIIIIEILRLSATHFILVLLKMEFSTYNLWVGTKLNRINPKLDLKLKKNIRKNCTRY